MCSASVHRQASADRSMVTQLNTHRHHSLQGTRQNWTDLSHHAQLSMCTSRDKMAASGMEFSVLIECEFVAVVSWKVGWLWFFYIKICTRPIGRLVSQFYSSLGCFYPSWTTGRVVSSNTGWLLPTYWKGFQHSPYKRVASHCSELHIDNHSCINESFDMFRDVI